MIKGTLVVPVLLSISSVSGAQPETSAALRDRAQQHVDEALEPFRSDGGPGCICAVQSEGAVVASGAAGMASLEFQIPMNSGVSLHVGSIAKQFVAAISLMLEERGRLDLDAPVTDLVPELPELYRSVTGRRLLTHTSGVRDYLQAAHHAGAGLHEPPSREDILVFLARQSRLDFPPGSEAVYSNSNYFLLKVMIERTEREAISRVAQRLLFEPLGMRSSQFLSDGLEIVPHRARGYTETADGSHRLHEPAAGVGGMLATLDDLLLWTGHFRQMRLRGDPLLAALTTPARLTDGRLTNEAAGLRIDVRFDRPVVEHNGSNRGFNAYLGWYPDDDVFVVVMCNVRQARATSLAHEIAAGVFDHAPSSRSSYPSLDTEALERLAPYAGVYEAVGSEGALEIEVDAPHAIVTIYGDHPTESRTASNVLAATDAPDVFTLFRLPAGGRLSLAAATPIPAVVFTSPGRGARRFLKAPPGEAELENVAGRFYSHDLNVVYSLSVEGGALRLAIERPAGRVVDRGSLTPITGDFYTFERDPVSNIRLRRDARRQVVGFELSEPRLRGVAFRRLVDGE